MITARKGNLKEPFSVKSTVPIDRTLMNKAKQ
jgi:hypothetical protein